MYLFVLSVNCYFLSCSVDWAIDIHSVNLNWNVTLMLMLLTYLWLPSSVVLEVHLPLLVDPLLRPDNPIDHVCFVLLEQACPLLVSRQIGCIADDDQAVLGSCNRHVDAVVFFDEVAWLGPHHWYKDDVELTTLGAVNWNDLFLHIFICKDLHYLILLCIVRSDHKDVSFCKLDISYFLDCFGFIELF